MKTIFLNSRIKKYLPLFIIPLAVALVIACDDGGDGGDLIPAISSVSPTSGEPGDEITITGTNLDEATSVMIGTGSATILTNTSTEITATIPEDASTGSVTVTTSGGIAVSADEFTVIIVGAVTVSEVSPMSAEAGETVTITGTDMMTVSSVTIGEVEATITATTETTVEIEVGADTDLGQQTFTIVNDGGSTTTSTSELEFYVIKLIDNRFIERFEDADEAVEGGSYVDFVGSQDAEEHTVHGRSNDATVIDTSMDLPPAKDGVFWHMEGYSSNELAGSYIGQLALATQDLGTFQDFFTGVLAQDIYYNVLVNVGDLPEGYGDLDTDYLFGLRFRFDGASSSEIYEFRATLGKLQSLGFEPDEDGWYDLSIPATEFVDLENFGNFEFINMRKYGIAARRAYGAGTDLPLSENGGEFYTFSFDNISISVGGPHSDLR